MLPGIRLLTIGFMLLGFVCPSVYPKGESEVPSGAATGAEVPTSGHVEGVTDSDEATVAPGYGDQKDVILVLDNSGSMKKNDPDFLTSRAVTEFIEGLDEATRVAIIIFDEAVNFTIPLTPISSDSRERILASLKHIDYRGLFTDSSTAIERAVYELKNNGRDNARKLIIFMTDGIIDTGKPETDLKNEIWLTESLAPDADESGIRIFAIAFTEAADFKLIQSLAQTTKAEYFRALEAEDLYAVFEKINEIISQTPGQPAAGAAPISGQQPVTIGVPVKTTEGISKEERIRFVIFTVIALVLSITLVAILVLLARRGRETVTHKEEYTAEAYLKDVHGYTSRSSHKLSNRPAMLGRVAGKDTRQLDYIVIPEETIGRRHALIEFKDFAYWIVDQGSINGTFVNDRLINSEVRLKHGDKIKLHKYEFEFVMPEMVDAEMTAVSKTLFAGQSPVFSEDMRGEVEVPEGDGFEDELELGYGLDEQAVDMTGPVEDNPERTLVRGEADTSEQEPDIDPEAETQIHERVMPRPDGPTSTQESLGADDETLMPGGFGMADEEATIRKEGPDDENTLNNLIDYNRLKDNTDNNN